MERLLSDMKVGETSTIHFVQEGVSYLKILEMGCVSGAQVTVVHKAVLGGPMAIRIAGYTLSLRMSDAQMIHVA